MEIEYMLHHTLKKLKDYEKDLIFCINAGDPNRV
jgi:hypothetical protein